MRMPQQERPRPFERRSQASSRIANGTTAASYGWSGANAFRIRSADPDRKSAIRDVMGSSVGRAGGGICVVRPLRGNTVVGRG